jgi:hypothetical protein
MAGGGALTGQGARGGFVGRPVRALHVGGAKRREFGRLQFGAERRSEAGGGVVGSGRSSRQPRGGTVVQVGDVRRRRGGCAGSWEEDELPEEQLVKRSQNCSDLQEIGRK